MREDILTADPIALTQREMLLRLDARFDKFEPRVRALEDEALIAKTERRTILSIFSSLRATILVAASVGPIVAAVIAVTSSKP